MVKKDIYRTEDPKEHTFLSMAMHTYAHQHPKELLELSYRKIPSQIGVYHLRKKSLTSTYHLGDVTIQHITEDTPHITFSGRNKKVRIKAKQKLQRITNIILSPLESSGEL